MIESTRRRIIFALTLALVVISTAAFAEDLTVSQILFAHKAGAPEENMIKLIHEAPTVAPLSPAQLDSMRAAGVSERVTQALLERSAAHAAAPPDPGQAAPGMVRAAAGAAQAAEGAAQAAAGAAQAAGAPHAEERPAAVPGTLPATAGNPSATGSSAPGQIAVGGGAVVNPPGGIAVAPAVAMSGQPVMIEPLVRMTKMLKKDQMGTFGLKDNRVEWYDSKESKNNFSLFGNVLKSVWLECEPRPQGNFCFELGMNTLTGETYRFRDMDWEKGGNAHILQLYQTLKARFPHIVFQEKVKS